MIICIVYSGNTQSYFTISWQHNKSPCWKALTCPCFLKQLFMQLVELLYTYCRVVPVPLWNASAPCMFYSYPINCKILSPDQIQSAKGYWQTICYILFCLPTIGYPDAMHWRYMKSDVFTELKLMNFNSAATPPSLFKLSKSISDFEAVCSSFLAVLLITLSFLFYIFVGNYFFYFFLSIRFIIYYNYYIVLIATEQFICTAWRCLETCRLWSFFKHYILHC